MLMMRKIADGLIYLDGAFAASVSLIVISDRRRPLPGEDSERKAFNR